MDVEPASEAAPTVEGPTAGAFKKRISQRKLRKKTESKFIAQVPVEVDHHLFRMYREYPIIDRVQGRGCHVPASLLGTHFA